MLTWDLLLLLLVQLAALVKAVTAPEYLLMRSTLVGLVDPVGAILMRLHLLHHAWKSFLQ
jgi:hypothetical protein